MLKTIGALLLFAGVILAGPMYSVTLLQFPSHNNGISMSAINDLGQVAGQCTCGTIYQSVEQAYIFTTSGYTAIPMPAGWINSGASGINNSGQVIGQGEIGMGFPGAFTDGIFIGTVSGSTAVPLINGWTEFEASTINNMGQFAGDGFNGSNGQAFIGTASGITPIPLTGDFTNSFARGINDSGQVTGYSLEGSYIGTIAGMTPIPVGFPAAINDSDQVIGNPIDPSTGAVIGGLSGSMVLPAPPGFSPGYAASINNSGVVVGDYAVNGIWAGSWIWSPRTGTVLLDTLVPTGWHITHAINISNSGLILALASFNNVSGGYVVLSPNPSLTPQTITFGTLSNVNLGGAPFALSATATSSLPVAFSSSTPKVCTVAGSTVTSLISGGCSINATQAGDTTYAAAAPVTQRFTVPFADVTADDPFLAEVNALAQYGITAGCAVDQFCPTLNVTRDEMAIFIVRAIYGSDNFLYTTTPYFTDVTPSTFGFQWIQKLKDLGITSGCTATTYCPSIAVTRDQMAVFIIRARLGVDIAGSAPTFTYPSAPYFTDATAGSEFAFPWIQRMKPESITNGCTATTYCSSQPVTREEMATFVMRGAFNQFLPAGTPLISQISPATLAVGTSGIYTITGVNTNFVQGTTVLSPIPGVTVGTVTVASPTTMTVQLTAASNAVRQPYSVLALTGAEEDVLPNRLLIQ